MAEKIKILVVSDKFKGSLTAVEACEAVKRGLERGCLDSIPAPDVLIHSLPMADGGEGSLDVVENAIGGERLHAIVCDPLFREIRAPYLLRNKLAFIEMAASSGLQLLKREEYNPSVASTYGLGETILDALRSGARDIIVGIGGSATNDGGMGMLKALGYSFLDRRGEEALSLNDVYEISDEHVTELLNEVKFTIASDVNNPLLGENGASLVYGPQKGADHEMVGKLEVGMKNYADVCEVFTGRFCREHPGTGAAGGTGYAFKAFFDADIVPGWQILSRLTYLDKLIAAADIVITGEGSVDNQSISGKLVNGICVMAKKNNVRVWVFCGRNHLSEDAIKEAGIEKIFEISRLAKKNDDSIKNAAEYLEKTAYDSATFLTGL